MDAALAVSGVGWRYGAGFALESVSFTVPAGRFTALLGPNGAGKSTLFSLISGLTRPQTGRIAVFGADMATRPSAALAAMGLVFQQSTLDLDLSVLENLRYGAALQGMSRRDAADAAERELARFGLSERRHEVARALNGGHRRRVEIARALLHRPRLVILDEATVGLDLPTRRALVAHIRRLCAEEGVAALWATHLIDEIDPATDRLILLHRGVVRAEEEASALLGRLGAADVAAAFDALTGAA